MDANILTNIIFLVGLIFLIIGLMRASESERIPKETIRYIPRSLEEEQKEPVKVEQIFKSMFEQQTPWIGSFNDYNVKFRRELDKERGIFSK